MLVFGTERDCGCDARFWMRHGPVHPFADEQPAFQAEEAQLSYEEYQTLRASERLGL